jgi:hypothetical protein
VGTHIHGQRRGVVTRLAAVTAVALVEEYGVEGLCFLGVEVYFEGDFPMSSLRCK